MALWVLWFAPVIDATCPPFPQSRTPRCFQFAIPTGFLSSESLIGFALPLARFDESPRGKTNRPKPCSKVVLNPYLEVRKGFVVWLPYKKFWRIDQAFISNSESCEDQVLPAGHVHRRPGRLGAPEVREPQGRGQLPGAGRALPGGVHGSEPWRRGGPCGSCSSRFFGGHFLCCGFNRKPQEQNTHFGAVMLPSHMNRPASLFS